MFPKLTTLWGLCLVVPFFLTAQADTLLPNSYILPSDSIFFKLDGSRKLIHHRVQSGQTLYSISSFYGLNVDAIYALNPVLRDNPLLSIGQELVISIPNKAIVRYPDDVTDLSYYARLFYRVQPGDNLYNIAKRHFNMPVDSVMMHNELSSEVLRPGQVLQLGWINTRGIPSDWQSNANLPRGEMWQQFMSEKEKRKEYQGQGVCLWQKDHKEEGSFYALHRSAGIGTVMLIENPMSKRKTPVKVIGRIPDGFDNNIEVILSSEAARFLGAVDTRFFVKTTYLK